jgi:hypothetical protein
LNVAENNVIINTNGRKVLMKKFVLLLAIFALFTNINAYSVETNASNYEVMPISEVSTVENTDEIKKCSNFILVDSSSYWLEENFTTYARTNISNEDELLKACCCFHDYKQTSKLYDFIRDVERKIQ